jgi:hypothetical protein
MLISHLGVLSFDISFLSSDQIAFWAARKCSLPHFDLNYNSTYNFARSLQEDFHAMSKYRLLSSFYCGENACKRELPLSWERAWKFMDTSYKLRSGGGLLGTGTYKAGSK